MAESYAPFDSGAGSPFNSAQWRDIFNWFSGILDGGLAVSAGSGMTVNVAAGKAALSGIWYNNSASLPIPIAASDPTNPRMDLIVVHADLVGQTVAAQAKTGTPAPSPVAPTVTQSSTVWEIALAQVRVPAGATSSAQFTIADVRVNAAPLTPTSGGDAASLLTKIKTVDGSGSGLDADTLDGHDTSYFLQALASAGGGAAGVKIWVGTTDPGGSASEGDIWVSA